MDFRALDHQSADDLRARGGLKWTTYPDAIGAFVAESDYGTAPSVVDAVRARVDVEGFGYTPTHVRADAVNAFTRWAADRYAWDVDPARVQLIPDVLSSLEIALTHFTRPDAAVILPTPAYMPFFGLLRSHGRAIVETPMLREADAWEFDYDAIDHAFASGAGLLILVNPANPIGAVFTREQLLPLVDIVERHGGRVWSDEIHAPLRFDGRPHVSYASLSDTAAAHTITAASISKGWNTPGLKCAQTIFSAEESARGATASESAAFATAHLGIYATAAAYNDGREWMDGLVEHLQVNRDLLGELIAEQLPRARYIPPQGTYLAWIDLREYNVPNVHGYLLNEAGVALTDGNACGSGLDGHVRLNFALPRPLLADAVARIGAALATATGVAAG